jgi:acyl dehydratase
MSLNLAHAPLHTLVADFTSDVFTQDTLALYAQSSGDMNPLHLDTAVARQAGFEDVLVHGMLGMAQLGRLLTRHFPAACISSFNARFTAAMPVGNALHCCARLIARDEHTATLALEGSIAGSGVVVTTGTAIIRLHGST